MAEALVDAQSVPELISRRRSGNPVVDFRRAAREIVIDLSVFSAVEMQLEEFGPARNLRIWIFDEPVRCWTRDVGSLQRSVGALYRAMQRSDRLGQIASDAAVLCGLAASDPTLIFALRSLGVEVLGLRIGGGLPLQELLLGETWVTGVAGPPLPGDPPDPPVLLRLQQQRMALEEAEPERIAQIDAIERDYLKQIFEETRSA